MERVDEKNACAPYLTTVTAREDRVRSAGESKLDFVLLESGSARPRQHVLRSIAEEAAQGTYPVCGQSRNSICYTISGTTLGMGAADAVLKKAVISHVRTNPDYTFSREADYLQKLACLEIDNCPGLIARFRYRGKYYLLLTFVPGGHPDPRRLPVSRRQMQVLFEKFFLMDRAGFIHYDLQASNIVLSGDSAGLIDFEFAGQTPLADPDEFYLCDYNISSNPYVPQRSCVCNFEFRTLFRYLSVLRSTAPPHDVLAFVRTYLDCRADYHERMAVHFAVAAQNCRGRSARTLQCAARHEKRLAALLRNPSPGVLGTQYLIMKLRFGLFERDFNGRGCDLAAGFSHARARVEQLTRQMGGRRCDAPAWYARSCCVLLDRLERKAAAAAVQESAGGHC